MIFQSVATPTNDVDNVIQFQPRTRPEDSPPHARQGAAGDREVVPPPSRHG